MIERRVNSHHLKLIGSSKLSIPEEFLNLFINILRRSKGTDIPKDFLLSLLCSLKNSQSLKTLLESLSGIIHILTDNLSDGRFIKLLTSRNSILILILLRGRIQECKDREFSLRMLNFLTISIHIMGNSLIQSHPTLLLHIDVPELLYYFILSSCIKSIFNMMAGIISSINYLAFLIYIDSRRDSWSPDILTYSCITQNEYRIHSRELLADIP